MRHGFSLVELSIVLVILGLLVGGILAGQSLIRAAELRAVAVEYDRYRIAVRAFQDKYLALPGDIANATSFWGAADGNNGLDNDCHTAVSTSAATCNGNANGVLDNTDTTIGNEVFRFWQHLANAGLVEGSYTGASRSGGAGTAYAHIGINVPASRFPQAGFMALYLSDPNGTTFRFSGSYGNHFRFGAAPSTTSTTITPVLTPEQAWNIDTKLDDGLPGRGTIIAHNWDVCTTASNMNDTAKPYDLALGDVSCAFYFVRVF